MKYHYDEGLQRSLQFWSGVFPIYARYRAVQLLNRDLGWMGDEYADTMYDILNDTYSEPVRVLTYNLRGFYLKHAQTMSTRDDFVPPQYLKWCKDTQDACPTEFEGGQAKKIVEESLGKSIEEVFEWWEEEPCGIASIGQVHRARLKGGKKVVVKIQLPRIEERFRADLKVCKEFCSLAMPHFVPALDEIERQFLTEFDYVLEAKNLQEIHANVMPTWGRHVQIPQPVTAMCSKCVLVMDELEGVKLVDGIRNQYRGVAAKMGITLEELEEREKQKLKSGERELLSPHEEARRTRRLGWLLRVGDVASNAWRLFVNFSPLRFFMGTQHYEWTVLPLSLGAIINTLMAVHAHEIFIDGAFNGDPHPGNILLLKDGRLGLIDYGQVKHIPYDIRVKYAKTIIALARDDTAEVARVMFEEFGCVTTHMNPDIAWRMCAFWNDRDSDDITEGRNIQSFMDWCEARDPQISINDDMVMCSRVSVMMRGIGNAFGLKIRTATAWEPIAQQFLRGEGIEY